MRGTRKIAIVAAANERAAPDSPIGLPPGTPAYGTYTWRATSGRDEGDWQGRCSACSVLGAGALVGQDIATPAQSVAAGSRIYGSKGCSGCHAINGIGGTVGPDLATLAAPSLASLLAGLWNHLPSMAERIAASRTATPLLEPWEAGDLMALGGRHTIMVDPRGIIHEGRSDLNSVKKALAKVTNISRQKGGARDALRGADVFVGVSAPKILTEEDIRPMTKNAVVFAMANPVPEIMPSRALSGGARIVATGRSDFPNQLNNVLVFPGIFRGALDSRAKNITDHHKIKAALAISKLIKKPTGGKIIPDALDRRVVEVVAGVFKK